MASDPARLLFGSYRRQILELLLGQPDLSLHVREIARRTGIPVGSLHRELRALAEVGILERMPLEGQVRYRANARCSLFEPLAAIFGGKRVANDEPPAARVAESAGAYDAKPAGPRRCIVIAGSNGSGKTTFAREYLPREAGVVRFVNVDLIAGGLSPLDPEHAALAAGRLVLAELDRLAAAHESFAFESTLSGLGYLGRLRRWKADGYFIKIVYLKLDSPALALRRIAVRVRQGGHDVPRADVLRRFARSLENFQTRYKALADAWEVFDNSDEQPRLVEVGP